MTNTWMGQVVLFRTSLPTGSWASSRDYYWMKDGDGTIYLAKVGADGLPELM